MGWGTGGRRSGLITVALLAAVLVMLGSPAPARTTLAQSATPVVADPVTPVPTAEPSPRSLAPRAAIGAMGLAVVTGAAFDQPGYTVVAGSSVQATLIVSLDGTPMPGGFAVPAPPFMTLTNPSAAPGDPATAMCEAWINPDTGGIAGTFSALERGPGTCAFTFTVTAARTAPVGQTTLSASVFTGEEPPTITSASATLTVMPAPITAVDETLTVPSAGSHTGTLDAYGGQPPYEFTVTRAPLKGTFTYDQDTGGYTYTARSGETGADDVRFMVRDFNGRESTATISITIAAPLLVITGDTIEVPYEGSADGTITVSGGTSPYTYAIDTAPTRGTVALENDGTFTYTANPGAVGADQFTVRVRDAGAPAQEQVAAVDVTILPAPLATTPLALTLTPGETADGNLAGQVTGGVPPYTFVLDAAPSQGTLTLNADGTYTYTANPDASGTDSFTYMVTDSEGGVGLLAVTTGTVEIAFAAQPVTPTVEPTVAPSPTAEPTSTTAPSPTVEPTATPSPTVDPTATATATQVPATEVPTPGSLVTPTATTAVIGLPSTGAGATGGTPSLAWLAFTGLALVALAGLVTWRRERGA
jgi:hypothetical protein